MLSNSIVLFYLLVFCFLLFLGWFQVSSVTSSFWFSLIFTLFLFFSRADPQNSCVFCFFPLIFTFFFGLVSSFLSGLFFSVSPHFHLVSFFLSYCFSELVSLFRPPILLLYPLSLPPHLYLFFSPLFSYFQVCFNISCLLL